ncbi:MAG: c-type cytochrome [Porticoccaceae bacterium]
MLKAATVSVLAIVVGLVAHVAAADQPALEEIGKKQFIRCASCHSMVDDGQDLAGPHLEGIIGRPIAAVEGFAYTEMLQAQSFVWDEAQLDKWLERPQQMIPGMCMPFMGLPRAELREALIAYLKNPVP